MGLISDNVIAEVRSRTDIVQVIGQYVALRKKGRTFDAPCPFHAEKTPSFKVNPERQTYHCFGCGAHGNVIEFIMNIEGLTFPEAVRQLAADLGIEIVETAAAKRTAPSGPSRETLLLINDLAWRYFTAQLESKEGAPARDYLLAREIREPMWRHFGLGFGGLSWDGLMDELARKHADLGLATLLGLVGSGQSGRQYDKFRGRIIFPIRDVRGRIIGFGGRVFLPGDESPAKYINSAESPVYKKSHVLYGLMEARKEIAAKGYSVITEGYADTIGLHQVGIETAVAPCGTALTEDQVGLLRRYAEKVVLLFDGDNAGRKAADAAALLTLKAGLETLLVELPSGEDPDSFVRKEGGPALAERIARARPYLEVKIAGLTDHPELGTAEGRARIVRRLAPYFAVLRQTAAVDWYRQMVSEKLKEPEKSLVPLLRPDVRAVAAPERMTKPALAAPAGAAGGLEFYLAAVLLLFPKLLEEAGAEEIMALMGTPGLADLLAGARRAAGKGVLGDAYVFLEQAGMSDELRAGLIPAIQRAETELGGDEPRAREALAAGAPSLKASLERQKRRQANAETVQVLRSSLG